DLSANSIDAVGVGHICLKPGQIASGDFAELGLWVGRHVESGNAIPALHEEFDAREPEAPASPCDDDHPSLAFREAPLRWRGHHVAFASSCTRFSRAT